VNVAAVSPAPSESARSGVPRSLVVADVGGTFARLALAETLPGQAPRLGSYRTYACADHPSLAAILADFTASLGQPMASAVVAIAGLLDGVSLNNAHLAGAVARAGATPRVGPARPAADQ